MVVGTLSARYGSLFLGHHYGDKFELHHHIEDGMVISDVALSGQAKIPKNAATLRIGECIGSGSISQTATAGPLPRGWRRPRKLACKLWRRPAAASQLR